MTNKLTAKLSDGTEWEVCSTGDVLPDGITHFMLKPIKREPREWYEVHSSGHILSTVRFESRVGAEAYMFKNREYLPPAKIVKVREVLE